MVSLAKILLLALDFLWYIVLAQIIMSWLINFQVLNMRQPLVAQIWHWLNQILEPIYRPIRRMLPASGGLDFAPLIVIFAIIALRILIVDLVRY